MASSNSTLLSPRWLLLTVSVGLLAIAASFESRADGVYLDAHSAISGGRGGTNLGFADNGAILHENPAASVRIEGNSMFDANATVLFNELKFSNSDGSANGRYRSPENPGVLGQAAYIRRLADPRFAVGLGIYVPAGYGTNLHRKAVFDGIQTYRSFNAVGRLLPSISYLVNDRLSLGASIGIAMAYLELEAPYILQTGALAGLPTLVDLDGKDFAPTATFGVQYDLRQGTVLGLSYTSSTKFDLEGNATVTIPQPGNLPPIKTDFDSKLRVKYPQSAAIGLSHTVNPRHRISADFIWYNWADAFDSIGLKFKNPNNPALAGLTVTDATPLDWDDSLSIRLGYELDATDTDVLRLGYVHHAGASPNDTLTSYIPAVLEHAFTLGYSHEFRKFDVNASYMYQTGSQRVRTSRLLGQDFSNSDIDSDYHVLSIGVTLRH